jgi:hypothetical protein
MTMASKTMEDWFLRGGERPAQEDAPSRPDSPHECDACDECDGHHHCDECPHLTDGEDDDDEDGLQDWIITMSRTKTVQQTAKVRVKAHSEEEAMDLIEDRAEDEAENWAWKDVDYTKEYDDVEAIEAEVAG